MTVARPVPPPLPSRAQVNSHSLLGRAVVGLLLLLVLVIGSACLLYASIDPAEESRIEPPSDGRAAPTGVNS